MTAKKAGDGHYSMPLYLPGPVHDHVKAVAEIRKISKSEVIRDLILQSCPESIRENEVVRRWTPREARRRMAEGEITVDSTVDWQKVKANAAAEQEKRDALFKEIRRLKNINGMGSTAIAAQLRVPYRVVSVALATTVKGRSPRSATEVGK